MNFLNKYSRFMRNTGPARFFLPVGIILIIIGILMSTMMSFNMKDTIGKVTAVEAYENDEGKDVYDITFDYTVDGKQYTNTFYELTEEYKAGDDIKVFYDPERPENVSNSGIGAYLGIAFSGLGVLACVMGVVKTVQQFKKSKELDETAGPAVPQVDFTGFKNADGVKEYYVIYDGDILKPGYKVEDGDRKLLYEAKMEKNNLLKGRTFLFTNHVTGTSQQHEISHVGTVSYNDEVFSQRSGFKFDGKSVWDLLHEKGLRFTTDILSKFPKVIYDVSKNGEPYAIIESSSKYVHEEDEAQHAITIPVGMFYYRFWTNSEDLDTLFTAVMAVSETEQAIVE